MKWWIVLFVLVLIMLALTLGALRTEAATPSQERHATIHGICVGNWCYLEGPVESAQIHGAKVNARTYTLRVYDSRGDTYEMTGSYDWWDQSYQAGTARGIGRRVR